ncbi:DUF2334 domain-containing protein [Halobacteria archaeon AArc-dxtr1]|nr:DUF2334 domain-containing protein [Halobacteria archaeon AArc-dxtr1]
MADRFSPSCPHCDAIAVDERIVEHDCGFVAARNHFDDGCVKCDRPTTDEWLTPVQTIKRCPDCGHRWSTPLDDDAVGPLPAVTFPTLPTPEDHLQWIPERFVPESRLQRQLFTTALIVMVLVAGITGAVSVSPMLGGDPTESVTTDTEWETYDSIVIFRNDDIQAWYNQDELREVNDIFIDADVPVTLGIIPNTNGEAPITDDPDVCSYLRSLEADYPGQFEMALHGYTHEPVTDFYNGSEFGDLPYQEQRERLTDGEALLGDCVTAPSSTFIPPMNTYDETTTEVLDEANYTTVSGGSWFTDQYYEPNESSHFEAGGLHHVSETQAFEDWTAYEELVDNENESETYVPFEPLETLTDSFDAAHDRNGVHVFMFHYQYFTTDDRLELLESVIQHVTSEDDAGILTIEQFALGLETGVVEKTDDGWRVLEPAAYALEESDGTGANDDVTSRLGDVLAASQRGVSR